MARAYSDAVGKSAPIVGTRMRTRSTPGPTLVLWLRVDRIRSWQPRRRRAEPVSCPDPIGLVAPISAAIGSLVERLFGRSVSISRRCWGPYGGSVGIVQAARSGRRQAQTSWSVVDLERRAPLLENRRPRRVWSGAGAGAVVDGASRSEILCVGLGPINIEAI